MHRMNTMTLKYNEGIANTPLRELTLPKYSFFVIITWISTAQHSGPRLSLTWLVSDHGIRLCFTVMEASPD
jgi:hypothetical protein